MTDEQKSIKDIEGSGGFRAINSIIDKYIASNDSVQDLDKSNAGVHGLAKQLTVEALKGIKSEINLSFVGERETNKTFE